MSGNEKKYLVSAIVSTYKAERFLTGKLEDLEAQTIADRLEIIVVDAGSPENERGVVEEFQKRYDNIRYLRTERRETVYQAWNRGVKMATGEFVANANTDDRLRKDAYEVLVKALREHPDCALAYPDFRITQNENGTFENHLPYGFKSWPPYHRTSLLELCCVGPFPLWRRSLHDEIGFFDERYQAIGDYEFWLRASERHRFLHVPEFLGLYFLNEKTVSRNGDLPTLEYLYIQKVYREKFGSLIAKPPPHPPSVAEEFLRLEAGNEATLTGLSDFVTRHPDFAPGHHRLAETCFQKGDIGRARKHFEKAVLLDPDSPQFTASLEGFLRLELHQSLKLHQSLALADPEELETQLSTGMILILLKRFEAAREHYLRALEIDPHSAVARENLAFLDRIGNPAEEDSYYRKSRPEVQAMVSRRARRVLDVGCGAGMVGGGIAMRQGAEAWGIEPDRDAARAASGFLSRVIEAPVETAVAELPEGYFDCIVLADVLEHLVDPERVLAALTKRLARGGEVVVSLPNVRHWSVVRELLEGSWEYQEAGILDRTHLRFFTKKSALALFERAGLAVESVTPVVLTGGEEVPPALVRALREGGIDPSALEEEGMAYQYLFRLTPKESRLTSIVILTWNELSCTRECLESIERNTPEPHEVILVDNGSTDGTVEYLRRFCAEKTNYRLIENGRNLGFAAGCNAGMRVAKGGRILLLNNDTVVTPGWLRGLIDALERDPAAGIVGPMTNEIAGAQKLPEASYRNTQELESFALSFKRENYGRRIPVDRVIGFCMLFPATLIEALGGLDERFGSGNYEDDDFCLRAALAGYGSVIAGDVFIHHYGSRTFTGNRVDHAAAMLKNRRAFDVKWDLGTLDEATAARLVTRNAVVRGERLARQGRLSEAVDLLMHEGIRFSPRSPYPYLSLAGVLAEAGRWQDALDVLGEVRPGAELAVALLKGRSLVELEKYDQASEELSLALQVDPEGAGTLALKGRLALARGESEAGEEFLRRAIALDPGLAPPYTQLASLYWERGEKKRGLELAGLGFVLAPTDLAALGRYHEYATALGELPDEERRLKEALALYPEHKGLSYALVELMIRAGRYGEAMAEIERCGARFGFDDGAIDAALEIRERAGDPPSAARGKGSVSLCMIVKDEAQHLAGALHSVRGLADELVVVDTGSSDRSRDIARLYGARLYDFPWVGDFARARNFSLSKASGDWILVLDADEVLASDDARGLKDLLQRTSRPTAFSFTTRNYTGEITRRNWVANAGEYPAEERGHGWTPSDKVRLFPNHPGIRFEGAVHELVESSIVREGIPVVACDVPVHHYGKLDAKRLAEKQEAYYLLGVKKLEEEGGNVDALTELARQATELGRIDEAKALWHRLLGARPENAEAYLNLGYLDLCRGEYRLARESAQKGASLAPGMKEAAFNLAKCEFFLGNLDRALAGCREMLEKWPDYPPALSLLSVALFLDGQPGEAEHLVKRLAAMRFDCADFLNEYATGLAKGERADLAPAVEDFARRVAAPGGA